ncbi:MAG: GxxExxY protein [Flavobacteriales bacterium]|nr:GxxExxY protein [Flavobacteriales bacterium]
MNLHDPHRSETEVIIGAAFEVANVLGHGLLEKPYENAMCVELGARNVPFEQQRRFDILYKGVHVGLYIPDLIAYGLIVVETKVVEAITDQDLGQMLNYLRVTGLPVGLILNFKRPRLEFRRVVMSENIK